MSIYVISTEVHQGMPDDPVVVGPFSFKEDAQSYADHVFQLSREWVAEHGGHPAAVLVMDLPEMATPVMVALQDQLS